MKLLMSLLALLMLASLCFGAGPYAVLPITPVGVDSVTARVATGLLLSEMRNQGLSVMDKRELGATESPLQAANRLQDSGAEFAVYGTLSKLGAKLLVEVNVVKIATAEVTFTDRLPSETTEDLDVIIRRLAKGIATGQKSGATATVENITDAETRTPRRRASFSSWGMQAGYLWPTGDSWGGVSKMVAIDIVYRYETNKWELEVIPLSGFRGGGDDDKSAFDWVIFDFSFHYFLTPTDVSPYLGGGLGFHSVHAEETIPGDWGSETVSDDATGFAFNVGGGVMFFRTYDFRLTADLRYEYVAHTFEGLENDQASSVMFTIGFAYARGRNRW
ncbi:porin family protein [bacterium]|nr:porin family protein [bacterium]